jgi:WD40 repeat protein
VLRGYEILGKLGRGGMGVVYRARQRDANRIVALKMILAGGDAGPEVLARFHTEIEAVARLQHPHIVQIHEVGEQEGRPYFSMEFADDGSLAQKLAGIPLPFRRAAQILEMLARAIHYAHERGVLHRDLTPSNVLLMADGTPKITDFGLAKILLGDLGVSTPSGQTQTGAILGTPSYMPPEQAAGRSKEIGPAGDVYALGAILYEMLTGRPPFRAETPLETLRQVLAEEPVPPSRLQPHLPRDLVTICLKCLQKEPRKRYGSALELAEDLQFFLAGKPIAARRTGLPEQAWRWCRRKPAVATLTAAVALLLVAVAVGSTLSALWLRDQRNDATEKLWGSYLDQAKAGRFSRRIGQRFQSLDALAKAAHIAHERQMPEERFLELRNVAIACLALPDLRLAKEWDGWPAGSLSIDFDDKLEHYARTDKQGAVSIGRVADDAEIARLPGCGPEAFPILSRDGRFLVIGRPVGDWTTSGLTVWKLAGQKPFPLVEEPNGVAGVDFSPDGQQLAVLHSDGAISLFDLASGQRLSRRGAAASPRCLAFHPREQQVAVCCRSTIEIRDLDTGKVLTDFPQASQVSAVWHPEGKTLAAVCPDHKIRLFDVATRQQTLVLDGHKNAGIHCAFNHAGDLLVSTDWDATVRLWDPRTGQQLFSAQASMKIPRFSPDDRFLAYLRGNQVGLWEVAGGREYRTLVRDPPLGKVAYYTTAIHSDGRLLAVGMQDGVGLWDLTTGKDLAFLKLLPPFTHVVFEPSGALLTNGRAGLVRWPVLADSASPGSLRIGPPQKLLLPGSFCQFANSRDGRVIATVQGNDGLVLHA